MNQTSDINYSCTARIFTITKMKTTVTFLLATLFTASIATESLNHEKCSVWQYRDNKNSSCGKDWYGSIICSDDQVYLRAGYAMGQKMVKENYSITVIGKNQFAYIGNYSSRKFRSYYKMPSDVNKLQHQLCEPNNREGFLCESCMPGYGPAAYYDKCYKCNYHPVTAISLYLITKIIPIGFWFVLMITFRIDLTKGPMLGYLLYCILHTIMHREFYKDYFTLSDPWKKILYISFCVSSIWNLDFLHVTRIIPAICISCNLEYRDVLLLNFISVLIPLFLVTVTYLLIQLHGRNTRILVYCWKPFQPCFVRVRRKWSATDSIIHAYASLLLLSFSMLNYNAYEFLRSTNIFDVCKVLERGALVIYPSHHVYTDNSIYYFVVVLLLLISLSVFPALLLLLHPIPKFREMLQRCCSPRLMLGLNTFVDTFQGPFKDGYNGTRNFRVLPGLVACLVLLFAFVSSVQYVIWFNNYLMSSLSVFFMLAGVLSAYGHPCKSSIANISLSFHCMWMSALSILVTLWTDALYIDSSVLMVLTGVGTLVPHVLMGLWLSYQISLNLRQRSVFIMTHIMFAKQSHSTLLTDYSQA